MNPNEVKVIVDLVYEQFREEIPTGSTYEIWNTQIGDLNFGATRNAAIRILGEHNFRRPPAPKAIRDAALSGGSNSQRSEGIPTDEFRKICESEEADGRVCVITELGEGRVSYAFKSKIGLVARGYCRFYGVVMPKWEYPEYNPFPKDTPALPIDLNETIDSLSQKVSVPAISRAAHGIFQPQPVNELEDCTYEETEMDMW